MHLRHRAVASACVWSRRFWALGGSRWLVYLQRLVCLGWNRRNIVRVNCKRSEISVVCRGSPAFLLPLLLLHLLGERGQHLLLRRQTGIRFVHRCQPWRIPFGPVHCSPRPALARSSGRALHGIARDSPRPRRRRLAIVGWRGGLSVSRARSLGLCLFGRRVLRGTEATAARTTSRRGG